MPAISLVSAPGRAHAVIIGLIAAPTAASRSSASRSSADVPTLARGAEHVADTIGPALIEGLQALGATGKADEVIKLASLGLAPYPLVIATGLGSPDSATDPETIRRAVGAAVRALPASATTVEIAIADGGPAAAEGALLGDYEFTTFKSTSTATQRRYTLPAQVAVTRAQLRRVKALAESVTLTRDLVNTPPNVLFPAALAERYQSAAIDVGAEVEILDERALKRGGYGGILGVGSGSARAPRLVRVRYRGTRAISKISLVGKGITFDTGGLNLKPGAGMATMKSDMAGSAAAVTTVIAAAKLKLPVDVTATVALAENMVSGNSYRPSDVLRMRSGATVEIANTDAEGRVVLGDAISRACEDKPDYLIETSTLTGAQIVALGNRVIAAMGTPHLRDRVTEVGNSVGEAIWAMPLPDDLRSMVDSPVADLSNLPAQPVAGMLAAGMFLSRFVTDSIPWVHLDIAGPSYNSGTAHGYTPVGGTGAAVRTLLAMLEDIASNG